ncbi:MAG: UPF0182 family protein [Bacillota bacterium]
MRRRRTLLFIIIGVILLAVVFTGTSFFLDLLWFKDLAVESVYWTQNIARWGLRLAAWLFLFAFIFTNLLLTRRFILSFPNLAIREQLMASGYMHFFTPRRLVFLFLAAAGVLSYMCSGFAAGYWMELLKFINAVPFQVSDPIFGVDVAFYVFKLPLLRFLYGYLMMTFIVTLILVGLIYIVLNLPAQRSQRWALPPGTGLMHITVLLAAVFGLKAWDYRLQQLELVLSSRGVVFGAGYTDIHANFRVLQVLMLLAILIALLFLVNAFLRRPRLILYGILALIGVSILGGWAYPAAIQGFVVEPSEFAYEKEYLQYNINFTRHAYGVEDFTNRQYAALDTLTWDDLLENPGTINNVRLWDCRPLRDTLNELQAIRPYYRFFDVDIDRYTVDEEYRQVMLAARELDKNRLAAQAQTWVNLHLQYTHGYGATVSPVNEVSAEGLPRYFLRDIPPVTASGLTLAEPSIYFGELTDDYVIVNTKTPEFHYATAGDENVFSHYEGEAGVPLGSFFRRALFAVKFGEYKILVSNELNSESRVLFDRNIHTRVRKLAPFLRYDGDPYLVINDGRLFWIQDAYTVSDSYPYSTPYGSINYIRNSVKVVIDAYNGTTDFYLIDPADPVAATYSLIFPDLFKQAAEMPAGLAQHLRYPEDLFNIQTQVLTLYHVTDPNVFYTREDLWAVPQEKYENTDQQMEPYYTILQLPGYDTPEFVLILPFTPDKRNNMIAWMVARCDQPNYGEVEIFLFPKERVVMGPRQVENRIDQSTEISGQFTLWSQAGSNVIRGNLLVLPINDSLIYVEPIFLRAEGGGLPELARVIVVFQETVVMEETLELALVRIFGQRGTLPPDVDPGELPGLPEIPVDEDMAALIRRAQETYEAAMQSQREGDWAGYGAKISELEQILSDLASLTD